MCRDRQFIPKEKLQGEKEQEIKMERQAGESMKYSFITIRNLKGFHENYKELI